MEKGSEMKTHRGRLSAFTFVIALAGPQPSGSACSAETGSDTPRPPDDREHRDDDDANFLGEP